MAILALHGDGVTGVPFTVGIQKLSEGFPDFQNRPVQRCLDSTQALACDVPSSLLGIFSLEKPCWALTYLSSSPSNQRVPYCSSRQPTRHPARAARTMWAGANRHGEADDAR